MDLLPRSPVSDWFAGQAAVDFYLPAIVEAELRSGVLLLPNGKRRQLTRSISGHKPAA